MANKWKKLETDNFSFEDIGRAALFLIPRRKLGVKIKGVTVEILLRDFLTENFKAWTHSKAFYCGIYTNKRGAVIAEQCRQYEVSFLGRKKITLLCEKLAKIALAIGEESIYFKAGQYSALIRPKK